MSISRNQKKRAKELKRNIKKARAKADDLKKSERVPNDDIIAHLKISKKEFTATICHPSNYNPKLKLVSDFFDFVYSDSRVIYGADENLHVQAAIFYTDTKKFGPYMRSYKPMTLGNTGLGGEPNDLPLGRLLTAKCWDGVAEALLMQELDAHILSDLNTWSQESQDTVNRFLARANDMFDMGKKEDVALERFEKP